MNNLLYHANDLELELSILEEFLASQNEMASTQEPRVSTSISTITERPIFESTALLCGQEELSNRNTTPVGFIMDAANEQSRVRPPITTYSTANKRFIVKNPTSPDTNVNTFDELRDVIEPSSRKYSSADQQQSTSELELNREPQSFPVMDCGKQRSNFVRQNFASRMHFSPPKSDVDQSVCQRCDVNIAQTDMNNLTLPAGCCRTERSINDRINFTQKGSLSDSRANFPLNGTINHQQPLRNRKPYCRTPSPRSHFPENYQASSLRTMNPMEQHSTGTFKRQIHCLPEQSTQPDLFCYESFEEEFGCAGVLDDKDSLDFGNCGNKCESRASLKNHHHKVHLSASEKPFMNGIGCENFKIKNNVSRVTSNHP